MKKRKEIPIQLAGIRPGLEKMRDVTNVWFGFDGGVETRWGLTEVIFPSPIISDDVSGYLHDGIISEVYAPVTFAVLTGTGLAPYTWSAVNLPPGLSINASTGVVSGTPTTLGSYTGIVISVTDANSKTTSKNLFCEILASAPPVPPPVSPPVYATVMPVIHTTTDLTIAAGESEDMSIPDVYDGVDYFSWLVAAYTSTGATYDVQLVDSVSDAIVYENLNLTSNLGDNYYFLFTGTAHLVMRITNRGAASMTCTASFKFSQKFYPGI